MAGLEGLAFLSRYPLLKYYRVPLLQFGSAHLVAHGQLWFIGGWVGLFALYYGAYRLCPPGHDMRSAWGIGLLAVLLSLVLVGMYPVASTDVYDYVVRAQMVVAHHANPFTMLPAQYSNDPFYDFIFWKHIPAYYGPLWHLNAELLTVLVGRHLLAGLVAFKLLAAGYFLAGLPLVYLALQRLAPDHALKGMLLYGWNPLLQFEFAGNGHNDALVLFSVLAAMLLFVELKSALSLLALTAGILVKFVPILIAPLLVVAILRDRRLARRARVVHLAVGLGVSAVAGALVYLPYGLGSIPVSIAELLHREGHFGSSLPALPVYFLNDNLGVPRPPALAVVGYAGKAVVLGVILWKCRQLWAIRPEALPETPLRLLASGFEVMFWFLVVGVTWSWPWYVTWLFAFAPLLQQPGYALRAVTFSSSAAGIYVMSFFLGSYLLLTLHLAETVRSLILVVVTFGPPLLVTVLVWHRHSPPVRTAEER